MKTVAVRIFHEGKYFCKWMEFKCFPQIGSFFHVSDELMVKVGQIIFASESWRLSSKTLDLKPFYDGGNLEEVLLKNGFWEFCKVETAEK